MTMIQENGFGRDYRMPVTADPLGNVDEALPAPSTPQRYATGKIMSAARPLNDDVLAKFRVDQSHVDFDAPKVVKVRVRRPGKSWFRVHPHADLRSIFYVIEFDKNWYLVDPGVYSELKRWISERVLLVCTNTADEAFVWALSTSGEWYLSGARAATAAQAAWICVFACEDAYKHLSAPEGGLQDKEPAFPETAYEDLIMEAFDGRVIASLDHEVARKCLGLEP